MQYRVRAGRTFGAFRQYGPGDIVELEPGAATAFLDKLEPVEAVDGLAPEWATFGDLARHLKLVRLLADHGYDTPAKVRAAGDEELLAIDGIGPKSLAALRAVLGR